MKREIEKEKRQNREREREREREIEIERERDRKCERARENLEINQHCPKKKTLKLTNSGTSRMMIEFRVMQKSLTTERERATNKHIHTQAHTQHGIFQDKDVQCRMH